MPDSLSHLPSAPRATRWTRIRAPHVPRRPAPRGLSLEELGDRTVPAVTAVAQGSQLLITGDGLDNAIVVSRDAAGTILVNGGQVPIAGRPPTVANTFQILVSAGAGDDAVSLDEANGPLPQVRALGGDGDDTLVGGSAVDFLFGEQGDDTLRGGGRGDILDGGDGDDAVDGGGGDDRLNGEAGDDALAGGDGVDVLVGGAGDDALAGGAGDDVFQWAPGDGDDVVDGQAGFDSFAFDGSNDDERIDLSARCGRLRITRDVDRVALSVGGVERVTVTAVGGADTITVNDLAGTGVEEVDIDIFRLGGGPAGLANTVVVNGTNGDDAIGVAGGTFAGDPATTVSGLAARVNVTGAEATDRLTVNARNGDDTVDASGLPAGGIRLTAAGGNGADTLIGSPGADTLLGGNGDDALTGGGGIDILDGGRGHNTLTH